MAAMSREMILAQGFASVGQNVRVSDKASFYGAERISIGDNTRIDDFCVLSAGSGGIRIGNNVHIAVFVSIIGAGEIEISDFVGISSRVAIYSSNDDYSGAAMTGPTLPVKYTNIRASDVHLGRHVIIGSGSVVLPGVTLEDGVAIGALSLVAKDCGAFTVHAGNPLRLIRERKRDLLILEREFLDEINAQGS